MVFLVAQKIMVVIKIMVVCAPSTAAFWDLFLLLDYLLEHAVGGVAFSKNDTVEC